MDKLGCSIKTLTPTEASHFKSYLRLKSKGLVSKKEKLFLHLLNGNQNAYVRKQLYTNKESDSAYYHLRKVLLEDLEDFLMLYEIKKNKVAQLYQSTILGKRASLKGQNDLAEAYFNIVTEADSNFIKGLKEDIELEKAWLNELSYEQVYQQYTMDCINMSVKDLIGKYSIPFLVSLKKRDVIPFLQELIHFQIDNELIEQGNKLMFIKAYGLYVFKRYNESMDVVNQLMQKILLAERDEIILSVWLNLLKMFIFSRRNQFSHAITQFKKIEQNYFSQLGTQYQLIILRWSLVMHVHANNLNRTTEIIKQLLRYKDELTMQIGKRQTFKLLAFIAGFAKKHYSESLYEMMLEIYVDTSLFPSEIVDNDSALNFADRLFNQFVTSFSRARFSLKTPENILLQHARLKYTNFEQPYWKSIKLLQNERL